VIRRSRPFLDAPAAVPSLDVAHRERRGVRLAQPAPQEQGGASRNLTPAASSGASSSQLPVAVAASLRMGDRIGDGDFGSAAVWAPSVGILGVRGRKGDHLCRRLS